MSRHRFNNVQIKALPGGLIAHQEPEAGEGQSSSQKMPMWPSERIVPGGAGAFHSAKVQYSKETADLIRLLVKESKMSMMVRKQIDESLRNGDPLPLPEPPRPNTKNDPDKETLAILDRARNAKRKNLRQIEASGAYKQSYYRPPTDNRMQGEKAKSQLQFTMAGTHLPDPAIKPRRRPREEQLVTEEDLINELLDQINERAEWLTEMDSMGQGKKYRPEIREQIAERLRRIQALESKMKMKSDGGFRFVD
ncbi:UPF0193 protein EVG1 homolog [Drosophila gunungcola]|uniref:Uncharacterized protein n=1 Tax=Drosophila gunungcola TaxID=103775 RepID=A0A9P9YQ35_9MUSC|nr:UPF0193 protein EVG1 homolog [Drosophila gunungcola]KAI8040544.1 hypothetical protein M5D96_006487 [Drosophila gunungcola]